MCATIRRHLFPWTMPEWVVMSGIDRRRMGRRAGLHWGAIIGAVMGLCLIIWSISIQGSRRRGPVRQLNWKLLSASCPMRPADPGDRRRSLNQVSFATFNVEWLFKWGGNGSLRCPGTRCPWADEVAAEEHLERVAQTIYNLDADVVNLVELESCQILGYLLSKMPPNHGYLPYVIGSRDTATGQTLGLLTRVDPIADLVISNERVKTPVAGSICPNANDGEVGRTGSTKHYATRISFANQKGQSKTFVFAGLHFLSGPQNKAVCQRREGQAEVVRNLVRRTQQPGDAVIITGDFNDLDNNCLGTDGQTSISATIPVLTAATSGKLLNVAARIPIDQRYSSWHDRNRNCRDDGPSEHSLIDHMLVSSDVNVISAHFHHNYTVSCDSRVSDHWPLKVVVDIS